MKSKLLLTSLLCITLSGCFPTVNKNVEIEHVKVDLDNDGEQDSSYGIVYYKDVAYVEPKLHLSHYGNVTEEYTLLYERSNFPMAGTTCIYTKQEDNPDYLINANGEGIGFIYGVYFRIDIDLNEELFVYEDIEVKLHNELTQVDVDTYKHLKSSEMKIVYIHDGNETVTLHMKKYPEIPYEKLDRLFEYEGNYYTKSSCGGYLKVSDYLINLLIENGLTIK